MTLLTTKLYVPQPRPNLVPRPRLVERLNEGLRLGHRLTLVSAQAGFGKTTLVSEWFAGLRSGARRPTAGQQPQIRSPKAHSLAVAGPGGQ